MKGAVWFRCQTVAYYMWWWLRQLAVAVVNPVTWCVAGLGIAGWAVSQRLDMVAFGAGLVATVMGIIRIVETGDDVRVYRQRLAAKLRKESEQNRRPR